MLSYQTELAQLSQRLDEAEKQKRQFRDDMERTQEALLIMVSVGNVNVIPNW